MSEHLWEMEHSYYCNESNYFQNGCCEKYKSFDDFMEVYADVDLDYNLLFRWDWRKEESSDALSLFWMQQRKGKYTSCVIRVTEADESAVRAFLQRAADHLFALWAPIVGGEGK